MNKIYPIFDTTTDNGTKGELGIDDKGGLYWNKKLVITKSKITLDWWVSLSIIIASLSTLVMAIYQVIDFHCN